MNTKASHLLIGLLFLTLNAFSNSEDKSPVSTEGLLLTDESPLMTRPKDSEDSIFIEDSTITIENDMDLSTEVDQVTKEESNEVPKEDFAIEEDLKLNPETEKNLELAEDLPAGTKEEEAIEIKSDDLPDTMVNQTVIIEPSNAVRLDYANKKLQIIPYSERRLKWGRFIGLSVGQSKPEGFASNFLNDSYSEIYGDDEGLGVEVNMNFKRNFETLSTGLEITLGNYKKNSDEDLIDSSLEVSFWKMGGQLALDNIFREHAYVVPYISGGIYQILYKEEQAGVSNNGWTEVSLYGSGGLMFNIDWLDPLTAKEAYFESGIENTFIFVEATYFMESNNERDPNFSGLDLKAGFKVEL
ncbi:MAG: hypothetical protein H6625_12775 [Bdellovibrionaceae bacterium]|nr:hypothetical protein [Pseudobdellovibrionaceae bacterium]